MSDGMIVERAVHPTWQSNTLETEQCVALGTPARLIVWATDYDGGDKAWVRLSDSSEVVLAGSKVQRSAAD